MQLFSLCSSDWLWETINGLFLIICNWVYILIGFLYKVFMAVARVNLFDKETFSKLTDRIYVVIGIAMLFIFAYNLILMIINPDDKKSTGATTKVVKETIISLTLVILLPTIFNWLYIFQNNILESNIIGKVILGGIGSDSSNSDNCAKGDYDCSCDFSDFRGLDKYIFDVKNIDESRDVREELGDMCNENKKISTDSERGAKSIGSLLMSTFYKPTNFSFQDCVDYLQNPEEDLESEEDRQICVNYFYDVTSSRYMGDTASFVMDPYLRNIVSDSKKNSMEFNFVMALVSGILAIYMFFCYTMEIGVRVAKLGVLQLISPIPVMMRIIPKQKEGIYDKWFNHLKNTYLDVFIRLMIIFFALFAISLVPDVIDTLFNSAKNSSDSTFISTLALVFVILGILKFAQEAPELLKDFFGSSGRFSLKSPAKQLSDNKIAKGIVGGAGALGAVTAKGVANSVMGAVNTYRNVKNANGVLDGAKIVGKGLFKGVGNQARFFGQQIGSIKDGYKYGSESANWDEMRKNTYRAATEQMKKPTLTQKVSGFVSEEIDTAKNFYKGNFEPVNSKSLLKTAESLDKVAGALKKLEDKLDSSIQVKAATASIDAIRDHIKKGEDFEFTFDGVKYNQEMIKTAEGMQTTLENLEKYQKEQIGIQRQRAYNEAIEKNDRGTISLAEDYRSEVKDNINAINTALKQSGRDEISNVEITLTDTNLSGKGKVSWKDIRDAGKLAGDISTDYRTKALEQKTTNKK